MWHVVKIRYLEWVWIFGSCKLWSTGRVCILGVNEEMGVSTANITPNRVANVPFRGSPFFKTGMTNA